MKWSVAVFLFASLALAGCSGAEGGVRSPESPPASTVLAAATATAGTSAASATSAPAGGTVDYSDPASWLCRPGKAGTPCTVNLDATVIGPDGSTKPEPFHAATAPAVDCFYVYPTVSTDPGLNSDMLANEEERSVVTQQFARLGSVCRLFAPLYRQVTTTALNSGRFEDPSAGALAYGDVVAAWKSYLSHDNQGRGVILVGHSQGSRWLLQLLKDQFDNDAALRGRLIAAYLAGGSVKVPHGADVGGDLANIPACRTPSQLHCVVTYATFSSESPPPTLSLFGRGGVLCVNPAAPAGGSAALHPYFSSSVFPGLNVKTPFVTFSDQVFAGCKDEGGASYLSATATGRMPLPKYPNGPAWGLHIIDVNLAMGDLVALAASEAAAYAR